MQSSFRPVALRLPLSDVAALAEATARSLVDRPPRLGPRLALAFRLRLRLRTVEALRAPSGSELGKPEAI